MFELRTIPFDSSTSFRVVFINGKPWFEISDVKLKLNYSSMKEILSRLNEHEQMRVQIGQANLTLISDKGLYKLAPRVNIPTFRMLKEWVKRDVIPIGR
ncbi:prophage antirepressor-like protein [Labrenzia sp. EL_13]|nr:prophage antirepressor-like protein [Labrenzia sp. EL_13]